jgi:hypothetical protein
MIIKDRLRLAALTCVTTVVALTLIPCTNQPDSTRKDASLQTDADKLNVSEPTFDNSGIHFTLNDTRFLGCD